MAIAECSSKGDPIPSMKIKSAICFIFATSLICMLTGCYALIGTQKIAATAATYDLLLMSDEELKSKENISTANVIDVSLYADGEEEAFLKIVGDTVSFIDWEQQLAKTSGNIYVGNANVPIPISVDSQYEDGYTYKTSIGLLKNKEASSFLSYIQLSIVSTGGKYDFPKIDIVQGYDVLSETGTTIHYTHTLAAEEIIAFIANGPIGEYVSVQMSCIIKFARYTRKPILSEKYRIG